MNETRDRVKGILLGLAAGDKIGGPLCMALQVAESLIDCNGFDMEDIGRRYLKWWRREGFDTGPTSDMVFQLVISGQSFNIAARQVHEETNGYTAGCNPAHRAVPLVMCAELGDDDLAGAAIADAGLTHHHALAGDVSAAVVRCAGRLSAATIGRKPSISPGRAGCPRPGQRSATFLKTASMQAVLRPMSWQQRFTSSAQTAIFPLRFVRRSILPGRQTTARCWPVLSVGKMGRLNYQRQSASPK